MDSTCGTFDGQSVIHESCTTHDITLLCELVQYIRAWWDAFQSSIQLLDQVASAKAHDAISEAVILARTLARQLGFNLPDFSQVDWSASNRPLSHASAFDL